MTLQNINLIPENQYQKKLTQLIEYYQKLSPRKLLDTKNIEYFPRQHYDYKGTKIDISELSSVVDNYSSFILYQLKRYGLEDAVGIDIIDRNTNIINEHKCKDILNSYYNKPEGVTEEEKICLDAYGKMYAEMIYMGAQGGWATPTGCCQVDVIDEVGLIIQTYRA